MRIVLQIIGCAAFAVAGNASAADPFSWELADVNSGDIAFEDGSNVRYRVVHIYSGNYVEVSVVIDHPPFGPSNTDTVLFETMSLSVPRIHAWESLLVVEDTGVMWGQYEPTTNLRCWRPDNEFAEVDCPAILLP